MTPRDELLRSLTVERFARPLARERSMNYRGPSAEYAYLERQRLLWEIAAEDDTETRRTA